MFKKIIPRSVISKIINYNIERLIKDFVEQLISVGNQCLSEMEQTRGYQDITGNLSASRGFCVALNGKVQYISLMNDEGIKLAEEQAVKSKGATLIVVAGMHYATYVEAKGYNVTTSAKLLAEEIVPKLIQELYEKDRRTN